MNRKFLMTLLSLHLSAMVIAQTASPAIAVRYFETKKGAIRGYDPVAYFKESKAVKGDLPFSLKWSGTDWYFKNEENRDAFKMAPEKYAPQYGGYCAYGVSENHQSPTDPLAFTVLNDKLYLNYNSKVKEMWMKNTTQRIEQANSFWPALNAGKTK